MTGTVAEQTTLRFGTGNLIYRDRFCYSPIQYPEPNYPPRAVCLTIDDTCAAVVTQKKNREYSVLCNPTGLPNACKNKRQILFSMLFQTLSSDCRRNYS